VLGAPAFLLAQRLPWELKRLGLLGAGASLTSMLGFLFSDMPHDMWAVRYLAPIIWLSPFALAPLASLLTGRRFLLLLVPYLSVAAMGGWLSLGNYVDGPLPRLDPRGQASDELEVATFLRSRNVQAASAHYWLSYRLTFLYRENPIVVPLHDDRYGPYREAFNRASTVAYVFHPSEPRAVPEQVLPLLVAQGGKVERTEVAGFTVLLHER
jgi:hypothetical protein